MTDMGSKRFKLVVVLVHFTSISLATDIVILGEVHFVLWCAHDICSLELTRISRKLLSGVWLDHLNASLVLILILAEFLPLTQYGSLGSLELRTKLGAVDMLPVTLDRLFPARCGIITRWVMVIPSCVGHVSRLAYASLRQNTLEGHLWDVWIVQMEIQWANLLAIAL